MTEKTLIKTYEQSSVAPTMCITNFSINLIRCKSLFSLDNNKKIENVLRKCCKILNCKILKRLDHHFLPHGTNICYILSTSHLVYSSWPEYESALIDISICTKPNKSKILQLLKKEFKPTKITVSTIRRKINYAK